MSVDEIYWKDALFLKEHVFERVGDTIRGLGDSNEDADEPTGISRCFNCGAPDHSVRSCPEQLDRALIDLSRALFQFFRQSNVGESERFHVAEDWKLQRLRWLEDFEPGQIRGEGLHDALGLSEGDEGESVPWLYNMLEWGYPPGWASQADPREAIYRRILGDIDSEEDEDDLSAEFLIFGEDDEKEILNLRPDSSSQRSAGLRCRGVAETVRRWATYHTSLFSSELLPIYNGRPLPPLDGDTSESAEVDTPEAKTHGNDTEVPVEHPWRHPDAFSAFGPKDWMRRYEQVLARRAQVTQRQRKSGVDNVNEATSRSALEPVDSDEDMDLSD